MGMERAGVTFASLMTLGPDLAVTTARAGGRGRVHELLDGRDHRPRGVLAAGRRRARPPRALDLGTGVLALQLRTPMVVAMAGATLQALHPDRDILLGVGISSPVVTQRWHGVPYGDRPLDRVREYVTLLRACLSGEKVDFAGDFYQVKGFRLGVRLGERRPKIVVGALNPRMLRAGRRAGRRRAAQLPAGVARARGRSSRCGRAATPPSTPTCTPGCASATTASTTPAATCSRTPSSTATPATSSGPASATRWPRSAAGSPTATGPGAVAAVSDRMVDAIDVMGDADTVHATMRAYVDAGVDVPVLMPLPWGADRRASADATIRAAVGAG